MEDCDEKIYSITGEVMEEFFKLCGMLFLLLYFYFYVRMESIQISTLASYKLERKNATIKVVAVAILKTIESMSKCFKIIFALCRK